MNRKTTILSVVCVVFALGTTLASYWATYQLACKILCAQPARKQIESRHALDIWINFHSWEIPDKIGEDWRLTIALDGKPVPYSYSCARR